MKLSLNDALELFFQDRETYCCDVSVANYKNTLSYFCSFICLQKDLSASDLLVDQISLSDLKEYSIYLKHKNKNDNNPAFKTEHGTRISSRTRKDYLRDVKTFYSFLVDNEYLEKDPSVKLKLPQVQTEPLEPLSRDEVHIIDDMYKIDTALGCRNLAIIHLMLDEGLRSGEVQRLCISDLHFNDGYMTIRKSKKEKGRVLPIARNVEKYLKRYLDGKRPEVNHDYVFCTSSGAPLTPNSIKCFFARLKSSSGIKRVYPHLLRHTFATSFILGGGSVELLRIYMGHSSIETTQKYLHVANNMRFFDNIYRLDPVFLKKFY